MGKSYRSQLGSRLRFALIGFAACLLVAGALELLFARVDMQGLLASQSARSLLFEVGAVRRSTRDRLKTGDIQITLHWHNRNDLDLWCEDPTGERIYYGHPRANSGGELDFDMNSGGVNSSSDPVENIHWPQNSAPRGHYKVFVNYFQPRGDPDPTDFDGKILVEGHTQTFVGTADYRERDRKQFAAVFDVTHDPRSFLGVHPGILFAALIVGLWFGLTAALLALALIGAENLWYRRYYHKPILNVVASARAVGIAFGVAFGTAALSQLVFGAVANHLPPLFVILLRLVGWTACFAVIGVCLSRVVPNVSRKTAVLVSLVAGWIAGVVFLFGALADSEIVARLFGAGLVGFVIGFLICLLWEEQAATVKTNPAFSLPPMRLQPYRMTVNQIENVGRNTQQPVPAPDSKPPIVPHEKPA
jgi:hypothetical protein